LLTDKLHHMFAVGIGNFARNSCIRYRLKPLHAPKNAALPRGKG
jgi:hypothetical protein